MSLPGSKLLAKAIEVGSILAEPLVKSLAGKTSRLRGRVVDDLLRPYLLSSLPVSWLCKHCQTPKAAASDQVKDKTKKSVNSSSQSGAPK